ncbi:MAG: DEAD/DEAH box helicase [Candidatus Margulisbacteria bacterium]|nr:DEAD/DEAH box helicase [Candidatus Margulisiibacteriota bacterium]
MVITEKTIVSTFGDLKLNPILLNVLDANKWLIPTPIQARAIPTALQGRDVLGIAQTGTGKTLAFGLPIVNALPATQGNALILVPTRELAEQVAQTMAIICRPFRMHTCLLIGGASMNIQLQNLRRSPRVVIATPGRLIDHLQQGTIRLHNVKYLVLDEADRMLDMGFEPQIRKILETVPTERQTMLFSATMPPEIRRLTRKYMNTPETAEVAPAGTVAELVEQELYLASREQKKNLLKKLLAESSGPVLVFVRTKRMAAQLARNLHKEFAVAEIHSDRSQGQRRTAIEGFKSGRYRILIATDIAARGIDVKDIQLVINYDLPDEADNYIHRIGRTGRAGSTGKAVSIATPEQGKIIKDIERLLKKSIPVAGQSANLSFDRTAGNPGRTERTRKNGSAYKSGRKSYGFRRLEKHETPLRRENQTTGKPLYSYDSSDTGDYYRKTAPRSAKKFFRNPFKKK